MELIGFETTLEFSEDEKSLSPVELVFKAVAERDIPEDGGPPRPKLKLRDESNKRVVVWKRDSCSILIEDNSDSDECIRVTSDILDSVHSAVPIGKLSSTELRMLWILPMTADSFNSLELRYRSTFITERDIFSDAVDSSVIIEIERGGLSLHHQSGAMGIKQLQNEYKAFTIGKGHPELFIFLETGVTTDSTEGYSRQGIEHFLREALEMGMAHSKEFQKLMEDLP